MSTTDDIVQHNFTLPAVSGLWIYIPGRDIVSGWTAAYTGTPNIADSENGEGTGYMYFRTQTNGTKVALDFTGVRLHLCINSNGARYQLVVDGTTFQLSDRFNDPQCREMGASSTLSTDLMPKGAHRAEFTVLEASESAVIQFMGGFTVNFVDDTSSEVLKEINVNDSDRRWVYKPARKKDDWEVKSSAGLAYKQTYSSNCHYEVTSTASFNFTGAHSLVLWGFLWQDTHYYSVEFDEKVFNADASTSMWRAGSAPLFMQTGLDTNRNYTITYRNFNENYSDCRSGISSLTRTCCAGLDRLQLFGANVTLPNNTVSLDWLGNRTSTTLPSSGQTPVTEPSTLPDPDTVSTSLVAVIGGVLGGIICICLFALALCWRWRRGRRRGSGVERPAPDANEDARALAARQDVVQPWVESLQDYITAYQPPAIPIQGSSEGQKVSRWATKPFPSHSLATGVGTSASASAAQISSPSLGPPLRTADLNRILAYVAARMDPPQPGASGSSSLPPSYQ